MYKRFKCHEAWMPYTALLLVVICAGAGSRAYAEEQKLACAEEIAQYCKEVKPGEGVFSSA